MQDEATDYNLNEEDLIEDIIKTMQDNPINLNVKMIEQEWSNRGINGYVTS